MRELTRSMASFSWAMSLFGVEQMANLVSPRRAADAFGTVARSAEGTLGPGLRSIFHTGDRLSRSMVDLSFSLVGLGRSANGAPANVAAPASSAGAGQSSASGAAAGASGLLTQVGALAFDLIQGGVNSVYWMTGTAWQQQKGLPGWGPIQPPQQ